MATLRNQAVRLDPLGAVGAASWQYSMASADAFSFTHGFAARPRHVGLFIVCISADQGYAVGDKVLVGNNAAATIAVNLTTCKVTAVTVPSVVNPGTNVAGAVDPTKWDWFVTLED